MKTKTLWKSVASVVMLMAMIMLVTVSCKKKDDETPPITPPPTTTVGKLFTNTGGYNFLTPEEQSNVSMHFTGGSLYSFARGIHTYCSGAKATEIPYFDIFTFAHELMSEKKLEDSLEVNFRKLDQDMVHLQAQMKWLMADMAALNYKLELGIVEIEAMMQGYIAASLTDRIQESWDSSGENGLRFYTRNARLTQQKNPIGVPFSFLTSHITPDFIMRYSGNPTVDMPGAILGIGQLIIGSTLLTVPSFEKSTLKTFVDKQLLQNMTLYQDTSHAMYTYKCLEDFFLASVNYQYQGLVAYGNCLVAQDTIGVGKLLLADWYNGNFVPYMVAELSMFNQAVTYLATNSYDYRTMARFQHDMNNYQYGVTEDLVTGPVYSRANLLNSLILNAIGKSPKPFYFNANFPSSYTGSISFKINGDNQIGMNPTGTANSQFYFTNWSGPPTMSPDSKLHYFQYQFDYAGSKPGNVYLNALVLSSSGPLTNPAQGTITRIFIDPTNIQSQSNTADATHTLPFGSATVNWPWGFFNFGWNTDRIPWNHVSSLPCELENSTEHAATPSFYILNSHGSWQNQNAPPGEFCFGISWAKFNGNIFSSNCDFSIQDVVYVNVSGIMGNVKLFSSITTDPPEFGSGSVVYAQFRAIAGVNPDTKTFYLWNETNTSASTEYIPITYQYCNDLPASNAVSFGYQLHILDNRTAGNHNFGVNFQAQAIYMGLAPIFP